MNNSNVIDLCTYLNSNKHTVDNTHFCCTTVHADLETIIPTEAPTQPPAGLPLEDFVPFGLEEGDFEVRTTDGGASPVVRLSTEFVFFGRKETDVYVSPFKPVYQVYKTLAQLFTHNYIIIGE